jgi:hypothetical protein|tara:strand:- start:83 stop:511 length:429 start_codon:yes stop_codon:yes gene_type:complete
MASLPPIKRISKEDLPDAPDWIEKVIYPVNLFFDSVYRAMNGRLTTPENIVGQVKDISFQVPSTYDGTDTDKWTVLQFQSTLGMLTKGLHLMQITEVTATGNFAPIGKGIYIDWEDENRTIKINYITGLTASKKYILRVKIE